MKKKTTCCSCDEEFKENIDQMVDEVKGYGSEERKKREREIETAFEKGTEKEKKTNKK